MLEQAILARTSSEIEALDLSEENERIADLEAELERIAQAQERALARIAEINALKREARQRDNGTDVATMLLQDVSPTDAAAASRSADSLREEADGLSAGIRELGARAAGCRDEINRARFSAEHKVRQAVTALRDNIVGEARRASEAIVQAFAAIKTLEAATGLSGAELQAMQIAYGWCDDARSCSFAASR